MGKIAFARLSGLLAAGGALALSGAAAHAAATLVADYEFSGDLSSSVAGAPNLIAVDPGNVGSFNAGGTYNWGGSASPATSQGGFTFDNNSGLLPNNDYSVALRFEFNTGNNAFRRILDFQNRASDNGLYAGTSNDLDLFGGGGDGLTSLDSGEFHSVVLTVGGGVVTGYVDGTQAFSVADNGAADINNPQNVLNLFLDNTGGFSSEWSAGTIDFAKFYSGVLDGGVITGPTPTGVPEPGTWALMLLGVGAIGASLRTNRRAGTAAAV